MVVNRAGIFYGEIANATERNKNRPDAAQYIASPITLLLVLEVIILNLQPETNNWMVRRIIKSEKLEIMEQEPP